MPDGFKGLMKKTLRRVRNLLALPFILVAAAVCSLIWFVKFSMATRGYSPAQRAEIFGEEFEQWMNARTPRSEGDAPQ